jgi:hypothetical protein
MKTEGRLNVVVVNFRTPDLTVKCFRRPLPQPDNAQ